MGAFIEIPTSTRTRKSCARRRAGFAASRGWLRPLAAAWCLVIGSFAVGAVEPQAAGCPITALPNDTSTSPNERAPNLRNRFGRSVYLIKATEMAAAGITSGTGISGIGWSFQTPPGVSGSNNLVVYLQNTADVTNTKSTTWSAAITGMMVAHNAATTIPNVVGPWDITFSGGSAFTYTGGGLYVAFDAPYPAGTLSGSTVVWCNSTGLANGLLGAQGGTAPATLTASSFRPETRLTPSVATIFNDASVDFVISLGSLPQPLVGPQTVQAVVSNRGVNPLTNVPVTFNLSGAETFTDTQTAPALSACGGTATVTFAPFTPSAIGSDTVTISVPTDDFAGNNSRNRPLDETFNLYSYKHPGTTAAGGVGFNGSTADFVAKFTINAAARISAVNLEFPAVTATTYRVAIYPDSGSGTPGLVPLYQDTADRTVDAAGPVTIALPSQVPVGPGNFFAGIQQTNGTIAGLSFDNEAPIRAGAFYLAVPHPATAWFDLAPGNNFKLNIGVILVQCSTVAECDDNNACTDDACTNNLCTNTDNNQTSCDGNPCSEPDQCVDGTCVPGPNPCDDGNPCTIDLCGTLGGCVHEPVDCDDNNPCTIGDACAGGICLPGSGALPPAVQFCNPGGITIPAVGAATPYPSAIVVTGQPSYVCRTTVELTGITHSFPDDVDVLLARPTGSNALIMSDVGGGLPGPTNVSLTLSDAAATYIPDTGPLVSGTFKPTNVGGGDVFPSPAPAATGGSALSVFSGTNPNGTWNLWVDDQFSPDGGSMAGWCLNLISVCTADADCNDGNGCTNDACVASHCTHTNNANACDDGSACTANDACSGGVCVGGAPPACDDGNACTANTCHPGTGQCEHPAIVCNDANPCTDDSCNQATGCVFAPNDNNACSDDNLCTSPDVCQNGVCVGSNPVVCTPDADDCTTEVCDPATGSCGSINNTNACDDGNACTTGDACGPTLGEDFDGVLAPALPDGWTTMVTGNGSEWTTVGTGSDTAPNSAFGFDGAAVADQVLISPPISIATASATMTFRNRYTLESTFDGGVLEIDIAGSGFVDILSAGGSFVAGGYTGVISTAWGSPIGGRSAWTGISPGYPAYLTTIVNLPPAAAGQTIQLQWRVGTDASLGALGQNIDSIVLLDPSHICNPGAAVDCDDGNPCTDDSCAALTGCQNANNTEPCDDGNACTIVDTCGGGACGGTAIVCNDSNPCTIDTCDAGSGCNFAAITAPPEAQDVAAAADKTTYGWSAATFATRYDVVRGSMAAFPVGPGSADEVCFDDLAGTALVDAMVPGPGTGFWYLVRGENSCGDGTYGTQGVNGAPGAPRITTTCQ